MEFSTILFMVFLLLLILIPFTIIIHRKRDWMIIHVYCPSEILYFDTAEERSKVCKQAGGVFIRRPITWIVLLSYGGVVAFVIEIIKYPTVLWFQALPGNEGINKFIWGSFMTIPFCSQIPFLVWYERRWMRKYLRTYLNEHGMPICMKCGYDLRGLDSATCPECGTEFDRQL